MATEIFINTDLKDLTANVVANKNRPTQVVRLPQIVEGETLDVELSLVNSNGGFDLRSGDSSVSLAVAVSAKGAAPTSGTFTLTAATETTAPIAYNASGQAVQDALNALNSNTGAFGSTVVVTKLAAGSYRVIFDTVGARTIFGGTSIDLAPESEVVAATSVVGSSTIRAQQVIEISQQPAIYTSTWTAGTNKFTGQLDANTARVQEFISAGLEAYFEVKVDNDVVSQVPIAVLPSVAAPNSLPAHSLPSDLNDFAADPSTNGSFNVTNWLTDLLAPHTKAVWGNITGTLSNQTELQTEINNLYDLIDQEAVARSYKANIASPEFTGNVRCPSTSFIGDPSTVTSFTSSGSTSYLGGTFTIHVNHPNQTYRRADGSNFITFIRLPASNFKKWSVRHVVNGSTVDTLLSNDEVLYPWEITNWIDSSVRIYSFSNYVGGDFNPKVGIRTLSPTAALDVNGTIKGTVLEVSATSELTGNAEFKGNVTIPNANTILSKQNCRTIDGGIKLQKNASDNDQIALYYEGTNSNEFVIRQYHNGSGTKDGQIKFIGALPNTHENPGQNAVRLDAQNLDVGFTGTNLTKIYSDTNFGSQKKFVFVDSRNEDHGLHFKHSNSNAPTFQFGMAGAAWNSPDFGQFKIRHTTSAGVTEDVVVVDRYNGYTKLESDLTEMKNAKVADGGYMQVGTFAGTTPSNPQAGMMIFDTSANKFKGYNGTSWVELG